MPPARAHHTHAPLCSELPCRELSWLPSRFAPVEFQDTCAASKVGACRSAVSFRDAQQICHAAGARLCTANELANNVAKGTGCMLDFALVWSSSPCGPASHVAAGGSTKFSVSSCSECSLVFADELREGCRVS